MEKENPYTHFYLYAKGWYKEDEVVSDLKTILSNYSGVGKKFLSNSDVIAVILPLTYQEIQKFGNPEYHFTEFAINCSKGGLFTACMSVLSLCKVEGRNIGNPDYTILPKSEN